MTIYRNLLQRTFERAARRAGTFIILYLECRAQGRREAIDRGARCRRHGGGGVSIGLQLLGSQLIVAVWRTKVCEGDGKMSKERGQESR